VLVLVANTSRSIKVSITTAMALQAAYQQFLAAPNSSALAANASLHYVTTTTSFYGPTDIIKHLKSLHNQVKKAKEDLLHVVEGRSAIAVEIDTCLEFLINGGVYLPGLDDNFVSGRAVYLAIVSSHSPPTRAHARTPTHREERTSALRQWLANICRLQIHIVSFDDDGKIAQIRQSWDQGALLKQLDVIGKTGRNWPIRDSKDQLREITNSLKADGGASTQSSAPETNVVNRSRVNSTNAM
jgi:hypothetical protein